MSATTAAATMNSIGRSPGQSHPTLRADATILPHTLRPDLPGPPPAGMRDPAPQEPELLLLAVVSSAKVPEPEDTLAPRIA